ncbi:hypothetical protein [Kordia sp.]|uniref:hypothetical protein n=1 Tax=Kordia sp. TaxID=1965332 RepID=UPI003B58DEF6
MNDFLERIQLIKKKEMKLPVSKSEFVNKLRENIDEGNIGAFSGAFEAFSSSKNNYKGTISHDTFEIRRRKELFHRGANQAKVTGKFRQQGDHTIIDLEINGFHYVIIAYYIFIIIFYILFLSFSGFLTVDIFSMFIVIHGALMFCLPYIFLRKQTKNTAAEIEKELYFMMRKEEYYTM